jgi:hypothetical protein
VKQYLTACHCDEKRLAWLRAEVWLAGLADVMDEASRVARRGVCQ